MAKKPTLTIAIPVYNEAAELSESIGMLVTYLRAKLADFLWEVVIADNASTDATFSIAKNIAGKYTNVRAVHLDQKGRGRAVKQVWRESKSDVVAYMDVDLSSDLKNFPPLVRSLLRGYDIAIGTRNARGARVYGRSTIRNITSKSYIAIIKLFFWVHFSDAQCGFKAVTRRVVKEIIPHVVDNEWFFDSELLLLAEKSGYRIYEEPVTWIDNPGSTVRVMRTARGDLLGLWRLFLTRPWQHLKKKSN